MTPLLLLLATLAPGDVDVLLTPPSQTTPPGCYAEVGVVLSSTTPTTVAAVDLILSWDPTRLELIQPLASEVDWYVAAFLNDPDGINDDLADGQALYTALANPANPLTLPPDAPVATFLFKVLDDGQVSLLPSLGVYGKTQVVGITPGVTITGTLPAPVSIFAVPVPSAEVARLGTPPNPAAFKPGVTTGPILGGLWDPYVDHSIFLPTATIDLVFLTALPLNLDLGPYYGVLLVDIFSLPPILYGTWAGIPFSLPIPSNCNLVGRTFYSQAVSVDAVNAKLTNAIDATIGTF